MHPARCGARSCIKVCDMGLEVSREKKTEVPLYMAAEEEVRRTGLRLKFPKELERRYQRDSATSRSHELRSISRIGLAVFVTGDVVKNVFFDPSPGGPCRCAAGACWPSS